MNNQKGNIILGLIVFLAVLYFVLISVAMRGWGYSGYYRGYSYHPSFWYWGGPSYYAGPSVRSGSLGGPSHRGGGPGTGK